MHFSNLDYYPERRCEKREFDTRLFSKGNPSMQVDISTFTSPPDLQLLSNTLHNTVSIVLAFERSPLLTACFGTCYFWCHITHQNTNSIAKTTRRFKNENSYTFTHTHEPMDIDH